MEIESLTEFFEKHLKFIDLKNNENELINISPDVNCKHFKNIISLSIVIMCRNEERCIARCLSSVKEQLEAEDELLIIDTGSTDETLAIVKRTAPRARIIQEKWKDDFSDIRNKAIDKAKKEWIFFVDADEYLEENALRNLKRLLSIINIQKHPHLAVCPTIVNSNNHVVNGVKRIIRKKSQLKFFGYVHEELRYSKAQLGKDVESLSFDNVVIFHDGYEKKIIEEKNKVDRNVSLLRKMVLLEPDHPRWRYFLSRDGCGYLDVSEYEFLLKETIRLCKTGHRCDYYDIRAISDLINSYIMRDEIELAEKYILELENISPDLSDVFYYKALIQYGKNKKNMFMLLQQVCEYKKNKKEIEYGGIHANYFHIDFLIARLFFEICDYDAAFSILKKLKDYKYSFDDNVYKMLMEKIENYLIDR